jgi:hypothetical protein
MNSPVCICSADRVCGSAATMTPVRIVPMSCAGDLVSFVSRRAECLAAAGVGPSHPQVLPGARPGLTRKNGGLSGERRALITGAMTPRLEGRSMARARNLVRVAGSARGGG